MWQYAICPALLPWVLYSSVVRASNRHLEGHGFDSRWGAQNYFLSISTWERFFINLFKVSYLFHNVSLCILSRKHTHSYSSRTAQRTFHCFDKANCCKGTEEETACCNQMDVFPYVSYIGMCHEKLNRVSFLAFLVLWSLDRVPLNCIKLNCSTKTPS